MENCLIFRRKNCKEPIPTSEQNSVVSLCALFDALATEENGVSTVWNKILWNYKKYRINSNNPWLKANVKALHWLAILQHLIVKSRWTRVGVLGEVVSPSSTSHACVHRNLYVEVLVRDWTVWYFCTLWFC